MRFKGKIKELDKLVVSDPYYGQKVWCRYERDNINAKDWNVEIVTNKKTEKYKGFTFGGIEFSILMYANGQDCHLEDTESYIYDTNNEIKEFKIGMDTASIAIGVNKFADAIKGNKNVPHPACSLRTATDGIFGEVHEGKEDGKINFIFIGGYLDCDAGYSAKDIIKYLKTQLEISDMEQVMEKDDLEIEM